MKRIGIIALAFILFARLIVVQAAVAQQAHMPSPSVEDLLTTSNTILGQPLSYPDRGSAQITSQIVTLPPGAQTGWHRHDVPVFGYVLKGQLTVTYKGAGERLYRTGQAFMEAVGTSHNGRNTGTGPMRILVVFIGADGSQNTVKLQ